MGFSDWFAIKTRAEREREAKLYERWAFPYGPEQKEVLLSVLKELLPEESPKTAMAVFLMGRERYRGSVNEDYQEIVDKGQQFRLQRTYWKLQGLLTGKLKKLISRYMALILADDQVGPDLKYPTVAELRASAEELEPLLKTLS